MTKSQIDERLLESQEDIVIDVQFLLQGLMNERGVSRADLARRTGISKARITQLMKPEANPTLRNLAALFYALGESVCVARKASVRSAMQPQPWKKETSAVTREAARHQRSASGGLASLIAKYEAAKQHPFQIVQACNENWGSEPTGELEAA